MGPGRCPCGWGRWAIGVVFKFQADRRCSWTHLSAPDVSRSANVERARRRRNSMAASKRARIWRDYEKVFDSPACKVFCTVIHHEDYSPYVEMLRVLTAAILRHTCRFGVNCCAHPLVFRTWRSGIHQEKVFSQQGKRFCAPVGFPRLYLTLTATVATHWHGCTLGCLWRMSMSRCLQTLWTDMRPGFRQILSLNVVLATAHYQN